jgi:Ca2+-binding EF-hand superfamily protein
MSIGVGLGLSMLGKVMSSLKSHSSHESKISDFFSKVDKDGNGGISKSELADFQSVLASESTQKSPAGLLSQMFDQVDTNSNGEVTLDELKAARELMTEHVRRLSDTDLWTKILNSIDKNGDGKISPEEMQAALEAMQQNGASSVSSVAANGPASILEYLNTNPQNQVGGVSAIV